MAQNEAASVTEQEAAAIQETSAAGPAELPENPFQREELLQFEADDVEAGAKIGKMLTVFFCYTVIVMSIAAWWTYNAIAQ